MMKRVLVQVGEGTHLAWKARAFSEGRSMSEFARDLIERAVLVESPRLAPESARTAAEAVTALAAVAPVVQTVGMRPHMKKHRPAVECSSRVFVDGVCPDCGQVA